MEIVRRNSKRKVFTWKMETFMKGQKTKKKTLYGIRDVAFMREVEG